MSEILKEIESIERELVKQTLRTIELQHQIILEQGLYGDNAEFYQDRVDKITQAWARITAVRDAHAKIRG